MKPEDRPGPKRLDGFLGCRHFPKYTTLGRKTTMIFQSVRDVLSAVTTDPGEAEARAAAHRQWASVAKPLGSLGLLETAVEDIEIGRAHV